MLSNLKQRIKVGHVKAALAANAELLAIYWGMEIMISKRIKREDWEAKVVDNLSEDLRKAYPEMKGLSPLNLRYMRSFYEEFEGLQFL